VEDAGRPFQVLPHAKELFLIGFLSKIDRQSYTHHRHL